MKIDIAGHEYEIFFVKKDESDIISVVNPPGIEFPGYDKDTMEFLKEKIGMQSYKRKFIAVRDNMSPSTQVDTMIHEILHAINFICFANELNEKDIQMTANAVYQLLARNHHLLDWIKENTKSIDRSAELNKRDIQTNVNVKMNAFVSEK